MPAKTQSHRLSTTLTRRRVVSLASKLAYATPLIVATVKLESRAAEAFSF